jgi:hypothetical protein
MIAKLVTEVHTVFTKFTHNVRTLYLEIRLVDIGWPKQLRRLGFEYRLDDTSQKMTRW